MYSWFVICLSFPEECVAFFSELAFVGKSGFTQSSYVDVTAGKLHGDNSCPAFMAITVLFVHDRSDVPYSDAQALDVSFCFVVCNRIQVASLSAVSQPRKVK